MRPATAAWIVIELPVGYFNIRKGNYTMPKLTRTLCSLVLFASLAACAPAPTPVPAPTRDPNAIHTEAAATVYAQLTQAVTPTTPPTATQTATPVPTATNTPEATITPTVGTPVPTATVPIQGDGAKFLDTAPHQYAEIHSNETYNLEFDLLNVGTTTWTSGYSLVWVGGEHFTNQTVIPLDRDVPPGKKGVFILGAFGSENMDPHTTVWQLYAPNGLAVPGGRCWFTYKPV